MYIISTTNADMKDGGTCSAWFTTTDSTLRQKHVKLMLEKHPTLSRIYNLSLRSDVLMQSGIWSRGEFRRVIGGKLEK